jgi:hypothetical protein
MVLWIQLFNLLVSLSVFVDCIILFVDVKEHGFSPFNHLKVQGSLAVSKLKPFSHTHVLQRNLSQPGGG